MEIFFGDTIEAKCPLCKQDMRRSCFYDPTSNKPVENGTEEEGIWHRHLIIPKLGGGRFHVWNCLLVCHFCESDLNMNNKHLFQYVYEKYPDRLVELVRLIESVNPAHQCFGSLADFVYNRYRIEELDLDFSAKFYHELSKHLTRPEQRISVDGDEIDRRGMARVTRKRKTSNNYTHADSEEEEEVISCKKQKSKK